MHAYKYGQLSALGKLGIVKTAKMPNLGRLKGLVSGAEEAAGAGGKGKVRNMIPGSEGGLRGAASATGANVGEAGRVLGGPAALGAGAGAGAGALAADEGEGLEGALLGAGVGAGVGGLTAGGLRAPEYLKGIAGRQGTPGMVHRSALRGMSGKGMSPEALGAGGAAGGVAGGISGGLMEEDEESDSEEPRPSRS